MADEADMAHDIETSRLARLLENRQRDVLPVIGMCHNCFDPLSDGLFCDADCRDDYERREKQQR